MGLILTADDGVEHRLPLLSADQARGGWLTLPGEGLQTVVVLQARTYSQWVGQRRLRRQYRHALSGEDYYWADFDGGSIGCGTPRGIPPGVDDSLVKTGLTLDKPEWLRLLRRAENTHTWSGRDEPWDP